MDAAYGTVCVAPVCGHVAEYVARWRRPQDAEHPDGRIEIRVYCETHAKRVTLGTDPPYQLRRFDEIQKRDAKGKAARARALRKAARDAQPLLPGMEGY